VRALPLDVCTLQSVLNAVFGWRLEARPHQTFMLFDRHYWLIPVLQRVQFKLRLLTFKALHRLAPTYLADLWQPVASVIGSRHRLRSATHGDLVTRPTSTYFGARSFVAAGPTTWNQFPADVHSTESVNSFKTVLKTFLFRLSAD